MPRPAPDADRSFSMRLLARRLVGTCCVAAMLGVGGQALAAGAPPPGMPPVGHTRLGVGSKDHGASDRLTRHHHDVWLMFDMLGGSWVRWHGVSNQIAKATSSHRIAMITLGATRVSYRRGARSRGETRRGAHRRKLSPGSLASGKADSIYLSYSSQANAAGVPV